VKVPTKWKPPVVVLVAVAALVTALGVSTADAGARVEATNAKFCAVLSSDQGQGINFEGLAPNEARFGANLLQSCKGWRASQVEGRSCDDRQAL
jgi:hypothetical protein